MVSSPFVLYRIGATTFWKRVRPFSHTSLTWHRQNATIKRSLLPPKERASLGRNLVLQTEQTHLFRTWAVYPVCFINHGHSQQFVSDLPTLDVSDSRCDILVISCGHARISAVQADVECSGLIPLSFIYTFSTLPNHYKSKSFIRTVIIAWRKTTFFFSRQSSSESSIQQDNEIIPSPSTAKART